MPFNQDIVSNLLRSSSQTEEEEDRHPWGPKSSANHDKPLLRTWDTKSGSIPGDKGIMLSRSPRERLDTHEARKKFLTIHADHGNWKNTPFISFTQSPQDLQDTAKMRVRRRGCQKVTVLNPNVRAKKGLPILNMDIEMRYYEIPDPYDMSYEYYGNHYVCLWEVTEEEFVGNWSWEYLRNIDGCWYEQVVFPAFKKHNDKHLVGDGALGMSDLRDALPEPHPPSIKASSEGDKPFSSDADTNNSELELRLHKYQDLLITVANQMGLFSEAIADVRDAAKKLMGRGGKNYGKDFEYFIDIMDRLTFSTAEFGSLFSKAGIVEGKSIPASRRGPTLGAASPNPKSLENHSNAETSASMSVQSQQMSEPLAPSSITPKKNSASAANPEISETYTLPEPVEDGYDTEKPRKEKKKGKKKERVGKKKKGKNKMMMVMPDGGLAEVKREELETMLANAGKNEQHTEASTTEDDKVKAAARNEGSNVGTQGLNASLDEHMKIQLSGVESVFEHFAGNEELTKDQEDTTGLIQDYVNAGIA